MQPSAQENISFSNAVSKHKTPIVLLGICNHDLKILEEKKLLMSIFHNQVCSRPTKDQVTIINDLKAFQPLIAFFFGFMNSVSWSFYQDYLRNCRISYTIYSPKEHTLSKDELYYWLFLWQHELIDSS